MIAPVLTPTLWESKGNIPALVRLLSSIIPRGATIITSNNQIEPILGIFQKLLSMRSQEAQAFDLLETVVAEIPAQALQPYMGTVMQLILQRLDKSKTESLSIRFTRFYHLVSSRDNLGLGADYFISICDTLQSGVFVPIYLQIVLPHTQKLTRFLDRKTAVVSLTKTLADSVAFAQKYQKGWGFSCEALLKLLENPPVPTSSQDVIKEYDVEDMAFGVGFTQLNTIKKTPADPFPDVVDVKRWVGTYLKEADQRHGGRIAGFVQERLSPEAQTVLQGYMQ